MNKVAITSTIYSEQELFINMLEAKNILVFDADIYTKFLLTRMEIRKKIEDTLYWDPYYSGTVNIDDISAETFYTIMDLLKPYIMEKYNELCVNRTKSVLFKMDGLFEFSYDKLFDTIIFLERSDDLIIYGMEKIGFTRVDATSMVYNLYSSNKKRNLSKIHIRNPHFNKSKLQKEVNKIQKALT